MTIQTRDTKPAPSTSTADRIRQQIAAGGERYWKPSDFPDAPGTAVTQALSRLFRRGVLRRVGKGVYYHPRDTVFGKSLPSEDAILARRLTRPLVPAGLTAANWLSFSTQNPARRQFTTTATSVAFADDWMRVTTRRPQTWNHLSVEEAALLNFLRQRALHSELSPKNTKARLFKLLSDPGRFERLAAVAPSEPPRVRAMLGAIGQEIHMPSALLDELRKSLNPRSRFDFGMLRVLKYAGEWQAR
jgi:hypothetical protein